MGEDAPPDYEALDRSIASQACSHGTIAQPPGDAVSQVKQASGDSDVEEEAPPPYEQRDSQLAPFNGFANLRDTRSGFPSFRELPDVKGWDANYFHIPEGDEGVSPDHTPFKHWCFLATIRIAEQVDVTRYIVEDKTGDRVGVVFPHSQTQWNHLNDLDFAPGNTMAIAYPHRNENVGYPGIDRGIIIFSAKVIKIFRRSLDEILQLSDDMQIYSVKHDGMRRCHGCDARKPDMFKCIKCGFFFYCKKDCQIHGWKQKGHKIMCPILQDHDFRSMIRQNWNEFEDFKYFPRGPEV
ncbi:hypothetical protein B0I35DRAFT_462623 [Stachybotrys elegans]|uniref:MYND-type domain-containing protein n=1 Tax=Stachybotrys elegans TaxID=80388 RepID=A0A8K0SL94_9HYPO|nr:hypothetical protein B0I35DRAFT_462623 [Stachybotrys elegans]